MLTRTTLPPPTQHEVGKRIRKATEILREQLANRYRRVQSRPALAEETIKQEIEAYCRDPHGVWPVTMYTDMTTYTGMGLPLSVRVPVRNIAEARRQMKRRRQWADQVEQALRAFRDAFYDAVEGSDSFRPCWPPKPQLKAMFPGLYAQLAQIDLQRWIRLLALWRKRPQEGWPKDEDTPSRYHAALAAVSLFQLHGLKCKGSRSANNALVALTKAIYWGKPHSKGWAEIVRAAIDQSKTTGTPAAN